MKLNKKTYTNIKDIKKSSWENLSKYFYMKYETLEIIEKTNLGRSPVYIEIYDSDKLVGISVCYIQKDALYYTLEQSIYGKLTKLIKPILGLNPALICYCPFNSIHKMYEFDSNYDQKKLFEYMSSEIKKISQENNCKSSAVLGVDNEDLISNNKNYSAIFGGYNMIINTEFDSFEEFLRSLSKSKRNNIRREVRGFEEGNTRIENLNFANEKFEEILNMFKLNSEKYDSTDINFEKEIMNLFEKEKNRDIGYFLGYSDDELFFASMYGLDEETLVACSLGQKQIENQKYFFSLAIYEPIRYAIKNKLKRIELGCGSYKYKKQRGAEEHPFYNLISINSNYKNKIFLAISRILNKRNLKKHSRRLKE